VVAEEIRKLAESAASYAESINTTLQKNLKSIAQLKGSVSSSLELFNTVESNASETEGAFTEITRAMMELSAGAAEINKAVASLQDISIEVRSSSTEMSRGIGDVESTSDNLREISSSVVNAIQEINIGIAHISDAMLGLNDSVNNIAGEISQINEQVDTFII
jgi:methyl-accepting chemotaxis protein